MQGSPHVIRRLNDRTVSCSFVQVRNSDKIHTGMNHYACLCLMVMRGRNETTKLCFIIVWCDYKEHLLNIIEAYVFVVAIKIPKNFTWKPCNVFISIMTLELKMITF